MPAILCYKGFLVHPPEAEEAELVVGQWHYLLPKVRKEFISYIFYSILPSNNFVIEKTMKAEDLT